MNRAHWLVFVLVAPIAVNVQGRLLLLNGLADIDTNKHDAFTDDIPRPWTNLVQEYDPTFQMTNKVGLKSTEIHHNPLHKLPNPTDLKDTKIQHIPLHQKPNPTDRKDTKIHAHYKLLHRLPSPTGLKDTKMHHHNPLHYLAKLTGLKHVKFYDNLSPRIHQKFNPTGIKDNKISREVRTNANHTMDHILDQIHEGHVNSHLMSHWMDQLHDLYSDGAIDSTDLRDFIDDMHKSLENTKYENACCPFGK